MKKKNLHKLEKEYSKNFIRETVKMGIISKDDARKIISNTIKNINKILDS